MSAPLRPAGRAAVAALDAFGAVTPRQARQLLGLWARRDELTAADVEAVVAHYAPAPAQADDPMTYSRPADEATGAPLPPGVVGYSIGGRA